jgi:hypothetical protein
MKSRSSDVKPFRAGVFSNVKSAERAIRGLLDSSFTKDQITVLCSDEARERHFREFEHEHPAGSDAVQAASTGSLIGATLGGLTTAGLATAAGVSVLFAGPSFLIGGAVAGGLIGAMTTRGEERSIADYYDQAVTRGRILVAVEDHSPENADRLATAERIFKEAGAEPVPLVEG